MSGLISPPAITPNPGYMCADAVEPIAAADPAGGGACHGPDPFAERLDRAERAGDVEEREVSDTVSDSL